MRPLLPMLLAACSAPVAAPDPSPPISEEASAEAPIPTASPEARSAEPAPEEGWVALEPGLSLRVFQAPVASTHGDSRIRVVRVDPRQRRLALAGRFLEGPRGDNAGTARQWAQSEGLSVAINASMFRTDYRTSTHRMIGRGVVNNPDGSKEKAALVFDLGPDAPPGTAPARIVDRGCEDMEAAIAPYASVVQSIRMVSCKGTNVWGQQPKKWSHAVIGEDKEGNILLIHARSPWSTHDFVDMLLGFELGLVNLQYAEGGPEAQLYVNAGGRELEWVGSYETGFYESDDNHRAWGVPNVVGVRALE